MAQVYDPTTGKVRDTSTIQGAGPSRSRPVYAAGSLFTPSQQGSSRPATSTRVTTSTGGTRNVQAPEPVPVRQPSAPAPLNWRDAAYNAQIASIERALRDFETGAQTRGERYGQDFTTGLQRLGYRPGSEFQAMPNVVEMLNQQAAQPAAMSALSAGEAAPAVAVSPVSGAFDIEGQYDPYSAAARGTRGLRDEFAARGTLRSSDFARNFGEFQNRLNQQLEAMETARSRFGQDLATEVAQQRTQTEERRQAAQRDAMMRAAIAAAGGAGF